MRRRRRQASSKGFDPIEALDLKVDKLAEVVAPEPEPTPEPEPAPEPEPEPTPEPEPEPTPEPEPEPDVPMPTPSPAPAPVVPPAKPARLRKPLRRNKGDNNNGLRIRY